MKHGMMRIHSGAIALTTLLVGGCAAAPSQPTGPVRHVLAAPAAPSKDVNETFRGLVDREAIDRVALRRFLVENFERFNKTSELVRETLPDARAKLPVKQREQTVSALRTALRRLPALRADESRLTVSADRRAAFTWLNDHGPASMVQSIATFLETGDRAAFGSAWMIEEPAAKADRMVAAIAGMTRAQRKQVADFVAETHALEFGRQQR